MERTTSRGKGRIINIPIPEALHRDVRVKAASEDISLKEFVIKALERYLQEEHLSEKRRRINKILQGPPSAGLRTFSDDEVSEWLKTDTVDPALAAQAEEKLRAALGTIE
jgi:hypothetical protein